MKTRRSFLSQSSIAFPALLGLNATVRAQTANEGKVGVALCGLGGFSEKSIAPEFPSAKNVYFAGAITGNAEKGRKWAQQYGFTEKNVFSYADMAKLAEAKDIQIVHVVTPNSLHAEHSIAAAKAGKHVMCEKPMGVNSAECEVMIAAAKSANVQLGINYRLHFEPHHMKALEVLRSGSVGDLANGNYEFSWAYVNGLMNPNSGIKRWLLDPKLAGGGALFDTGVYAVQAACMYTGKVPVAAQATASKKHPAIFPKGVEETMSFELLFDDGFTAMCRASYSQNFHQCTTLGSKGRVEVLPGAKGGSVYGQSGGGKPNTKVLAVSGKEVDCGPDTLQLGVLLDEFAKAIQANQPFKCNGEMGLRDIRIMEAVTASAQQDGVKVAIKA